MTYFVDDAFGGTTAGLTMNLFDELKGGVATIVGMIRQVLHYIWGFFMNIWNQCMEDPWKLAHLSVTACILFS